MDYEKILEIIKKLKDSAKRKLIKDISIWIQYLECLFSQNSLKDCAEKYKISVSTAFFWRHRILDSIRESTNKQVLKDTIQCDETYFNESFKGNHKNSKFVMPRKPHKRGNSCQLRGISHQKVCVLTAFHYIFDKIKASPLLIKGEYV